MRQSGWTAMTLLLAAVAVGCGEGGATSLGTGGSAGGAMAGGAGGTATTTTGSVKPPTTTSVSSSSSTGTGGAGPDCAGEGLYALADTDLNDEVVSMCKYKGDVLLIVNTAEA